MRGFWLGLRGCCAFGGLGTRYRGGRRTSKNCAEQLLDADATSLINDPPKETNVFIHYAIILFVS
jgi:hypothetical protein